MYYRLSVIQIDIPPLRTRRDDVLLLAEHFLAVLNERLRRRIRGLTPEVAEVFRGYAWRGNVRELRNVIERAMILEDADLVTLKYLPTNQTERTFTTAPTLSGIQLEENILHLPLENLSLKRLEKVLIGWALEKSHGNKSQAARHLGITRDQFIYRLKALSDDIVLENG